MIAHHSVEKMVNVFQIPSQTASDVIQEFVQSQENKNPKSWLKSCQ